MHLARVLRFVAFAGVFGPAFAAPLPARAEPRGKIVYAPACTGPGRHCLARVATQDGHLFHYAALPIGEIATHSPVELQTMYHVDPTRGAGMTVAVIDAYGYPTLEADLAQYRKRYGLPPCTIASGCLRVVNSAGDATELPAAVDDGWQVETALDVDMVSAGCPPCKILVVETNEPSDELDSAQQTAARLGADAISNSWGGHEGGDAPSEPDFDQTGVGIFASSGDDGYHAGPQYPATSLHVVAVGGTHVKDNVLAHTVVETAWGEAGSSCSSEFAAPAFQPAEAACTNRAASDISAIADPQTGVALYCASAGGWTSAGGTSASSPLVTAIMAGAGHPDATPAFVYRHPDAFNDITAGSNGSCATTMCQAGSGWDGPTGLGSPDQDKLFAIGNGSGPAVAITAPADGSTQTGAFTVEATVGDGAAHVDLAIDGVRVIGLAAAPYTFSAPALATPGTHVITVSAFTADHDAGTAQVAVVVPQPTPPDAGVSDSDAGGLAPGGPGGGGCGAAGGGGGVLGILGVSFAARRGRRRAR